MSKETVFVPVGFKPTMDTVEIFLSNTDSIEFVYVPIEVPEMDTEEDTGTYRLKVGFI